MQYKIFWCKINKYFTEKWLNTNYFDDKKWIFINSCIVTDKAKSKWIKFIKDSIWGFWNEDERVYLSWCWPIRKWELVENFYEIYPELTEFQNKIILIWEDPEKEWILEKINNLKKISIYTRKYIIIQNWCDNYCTFCLTIQARWWHKSRTLEDIMKEIKLFENWNIKEIVITWTNIWAWWADDTRKFEQTKFVNLLKEILEKTNIPRIRISSLWIEYINDELIGLIKNSRIYAHLHLSIQSWSDNILKSMNRNYDKKTLERVLEKLNSIKRDDWIKLSIWADFIVWFPWETDRDFEETLDIISKYKITKVHAFPFSTHEKNDFIPASQFPNQINEKVKKSRMKLITELWNKIRENFLGENNWEILNLLVEKNSWNKFSWWSENYIALNENNFQILDWENIKIGNIVRWIYKN